MNKRFISTFGFLILCHVLFAQKSQVQSAWRALSDYETTQRDDPKNPNLSYLLKAKEAIDKALLSEDTKKQGKTHAYKMRISYAIYQYNLSQELVRLEATVQDKNERYAQAYGNTSLVEFEEATNELAIIKDLDPKFIETIQVGIANGSGSSLDDEEFKFALAAQRMKAEAPSIAEGKFNSKNYGVAADYFYKSAFMNTVLYKTKDTANFYNACIAASRSRDPEKIIDYNKKMIDFKIEIPYNYISISDAYLFKQDTSKAFETLKKGRETFPNSPELLTKETNLFLTCNKQNEALTNLKLCSQKDPKNAMYYYMIGIAYDNMANPKDKQSGKDLPKPANFDELFGNAQSNYQKAIDLKPENEFMYNSLYSMGAMYNNYGAFIESKNIEKITDFAKLQKENEIKSQEYYKKAIPFLEQALAIKADDKPTMNALRLLYFKTGEESKAKVMSEKIKTAK